MDADLTAKHRRVLTQIDRRAGLPKWRDVVALLVALGAVVDDDKAGSRVGVLLDGVPAVFHKPHPSPEIHKALRNDIRKYLVDTGVIT